MLIRCDHAHGSVQNGYVVDVIHKGADLLLRNYQEV
ncbi:hypothetical protein PMIT1342_01766 [Prochlorococcus marinus str. MIT 1342]|nr:hypothetical protein PMIT1342_01766 [Prochlorococcus marinus str. MIT 1342]